jgi:hypothetical protein
MLKSLYEKAQVGRAVLRRDAPSSVVSVAYRLPTRTIADRPLSGCSSGEISKALVRGKNSG